MLFNLLLLGFLGAATYLQAIQGLTSAAITCVMVVISTAVSFGTYEYIAESLLMGVAPEYAYAFALAGMFAVPLIILRVALDVLIPRSNLLPQVIDRAVGGVFGFFGALLTTGVIACSIQMLPWGISTNQDGEVSGGFFGFRRFDPTNPGDKPNELWLKPDRFAVSFASHLSTNTFSNSDPKSTFGSDNPDLMGDLAFAQAFPLGVRRVIKSEDIKIVDVGQLNYLYHVTTGRRGTPDEFDPVDPASGKVFIHVALQLSGELNDVDDKKRYSATSVRLIGESGNKKIVIPAIAIIDQDDPSRYIVKWTQAGWKEKSIAGKAFMIPSTDRIEVAFEVPEDFKPEEIRFKVGGKVALTKSQIAKLTGDTTGGDAQAARPARTPSQTASSSRGNGQSRKSGGGRVSGVKFRSSQFSADMPMKFTSFRQVDSEIQSGILEQGLLTGKVSDQGKVAKDGPVTGFKVPSGKALLQLNVESLNAKSLLGKALNFSVKTVENYSIEDDQGRKILACGKYAVANVGGVAYFELSYYPTFESGGGRYRAFSKIKNQHLKKDYQLVYLFLIDKGRQAVKFSTGGNKRTIDLRKENLVAR